MFTGHSICCVAGDSEYREYAFAPSALHLQHPVNICLRVSKPPSPIFQSL